jgi:hypothetical protein
VRIRGYFSEPKGVREEESVGNIAVHFLWVGGRGQTKEERKERREGRGEL